MIAHLLAAYVSAEDVRDLYQAGEDARFLAGECYRRRRAVAAALASQLATGAWRSPEMEGAARRAERDHYLLYYLPEKFVAASGGGHDLDIEYHPLAVGLSEACTEDDFLWPLGFVARARGGDGAREPWMEVLGLEAEGYLHQLRGDRYLEQALARLDALERAVLGTVAGQEPGSPAAIRAHAIVMQVYRLLGLPWRVESTYRRFSAAFGPGDAPRLWLERVAADKAYAAQTREWFRLLLTAAVSTLELRHPQDSSELANLRALQQTAYFPPRMLVPDLPVLQLPPLPDEELVRVEEGLARLSALLPAGRARSVLRTWQAAAGQRLVRYRDSLAALAEIEPDDEALGILVGGLRGEARYRLANYEDACLDLRRAERTARAVLERTAPDPGAWGRPALDFLGRIAQKAGNALLVLGDDAAAQAAYDRAQEWLSDDPVARAGAALNRGNLAYLRNNLASERGYVTLDETLRQRMAVEGPQVLQAVKLARHVAGLTEAEGHYREALHCLSPLATSDGLAGELAAAANVNLGNTAWAWGAAMAAEGVERLDALPLAGDWSSTLVRPDFRAGDCYRAAIKLQRRALAAMPRTGSSDPAQEATAWSNLSELYYLLGEQTGAAAPLRKGVAAAGRALQGTDTAASALHPELAWRTRYNLARLYQALGQPAEAGASYREAVRAIEGLRANLRLDAWQATFLHDKLEVYEGYVHFLYRPGSDENLAEIFQLVERTKARAFLDLLETARLDVGLAQELADRRDDLLARVATGNDEIRRAMSADDEPRARERLAEQRRMALEWNELQSEIAAAQLADQDLNPPLADLAEVQGALGPDIVLLAFQLGLRHSYLLLVDGARAKVFELPDRRTVELAALPVAYYCSRSSSQSCARFRAANQVLVEHLFGALDAAIGLKAALSGKHVLIAPDGILHYLPFEALLVDAAHLALPEPVAYADLLPYYLLSVADVSYVPSASAWLRLATRPVQASRSSLLAAYNIRYDVGEAPRPLWAAEILLNLPDVPGARAVGRVAAAIQEAWPAQPLVGLRARQDDGQPERPEYQPTERNLLDVAEASAPRFFLFNGHGIYNDRVPSLSGLVLNLEPPAAPEASIRPRGEDGFLRVEELFRLALPGTELSFLAACQTALGTVYRGEGLNALTRAFMYRGSPAVVASLWAVDSEATARLLRWFFTRVAEQPDADRAHLLGEARRQLMAFGKEWCLPYFWAPFVLCGAGRPRRSEPINSVSE